MKIATILFEEQEIASTVTGYGYVPIPFVNQRFRKNWPHDLFSILTEERLDEIKRWFYENYDSVSQENYRRR